jgi:hypothetical protein
MNAQRIDATLSQSSGTRGISAEGSVERFAMRLPAAGGVGDRRHPADGTRLHFSAS